MTNHQRLDSKSNAHAGKDFEILAKKYLDALLNVDLTQNIPVEIGASSTKKQHKFDLGTTTTIIECKSHRWTKTENIPSAKLTVWNEVMFYFSLVLGDIKKILFVEKHLSKKRNKSLGQFYIDTYGHLIPDNTEIWEYDSTLNLHNVLRSQSQPLGMFDNK